MEISRNNKKMEQMRRVVVAVDESEESMYALQWCLTNFFNTHHNTKTTLVLLYVKPPPPIYSSLDAPGYLFAGDHIIETMEKFGRDLATKVMTKAEAVCSKFSSNINIEKKLGTGEAKDVICVAVQKLGADILVMGSHDYGFIKRTFLGSVSEYCSKHVKVPMVVVKRPRND